MYSFKINNKNSLILKTVSKMNNIKILIRFVIDTHFVLFNYIIKYNKTKKLENKHYKFKKIKMKNSFFNYASQTFPEKKSLPMLQIFKS